MKTEEEVGEFTVDRLLDISMIARSRRKEVEAPMWKSAYQDLAMAANHLALMIESARNSQD